MKAKPAMEQLNEILVRTCSAHVAAIREAGLRFAVPAGFLEYVGSEAAYLREVADAADKALQSAPNISKARMVKLEAAIEALAQAARLAALMHEVASAHPDARNDMARVAIVAGATGERNRIFRGEMEGAFEAFEAQQLGRKRAEESRAGQARGVQSRTRWHRVVLEMARELFEAEPAARSWSGSRLAAHFARKRISGVPTKGRLERQLNEWRKTGDLPPRENSMSN